MQSTASPTSAPRPVPGRAGRRAVFYLVEGLTSGGVNLLMVGIFFYTAHRFHWGLLQNFSLAAGQGAVYVAGALTAHKLTARFPPRATLIGLYSVMGVIALLALLPAGGAGVAALLLSYTLLNSMGWPILENQVSSGFSSAVMSRRIIIYNLVWSGTGAMMIAVNGAIIEHWPAGVFLFPVLMHACAVAALLITKSESDALPAGQAPAHTAAPEPELYRLRTMALWLSRVSLPATYVVVYSLMALMPSLPVMQRLDTATKTLLGSTWMVSRFLCFVVLGLSPWWHTRPRALLAAAALMLAGFLGATSRPSVLFGSPAAADVPWMALWLVILGTTMGIIYAGSLYFGMVLSEGSTEHGGYHEALIGLGSVLGPGAGALTQLLRPGDIRLGIAAVATVIGASVMAAAIASLSVGRGRRG